MVIVYGTRSGSSDTRLPHPCNHCRQPALVQSDWYQYFHLMFIPTFPVGKGRSVHCEACGNSFETSGSAPIWTFAGSMLIVLSLLGFGAFEALKHFPIGSSAASITGHDHDNPPSATTATPAAASTPPPTTKAAAAAAAPSPSAAATSKPAAKPKKKK